MTIESLQQTIGAMRDQATNSVYRETITKALAYAGNDNSKLELVAGILTRSAVGIYNSNSNGNTAIGPAIFYSGTAPAEFGGQKNVFYAQ